MKFLGILMLLAAGGQAYAKSGTYDDLAIERDAVIKDFEFHDGRKLASINMHYSTLGTPQRDAAGRISNAVMVLHGTGGTGRSFLRPQFADELFGPGQPLDITKYFIILPDNLGHGKSTKPSDGMRMDFPAYNYDDMVEAQRRMLVEGLQVDQLRLLMGTSMGCMHSFIWGEKYPGFVKAMMPMACLPVKIAGHNRMWRRLLIEGIKQDPAWKGGNYDKQPVLGLRTAVSLLHVAGFAPLYLQREYNTREKAEEFILNNVAKDIPTRDANDLIYQVDASRDYDPWPGLDKIEAAVTWVNSGDDFINPPQYGIAEEAAARLKNGHYVLIEASDETRGHSTHTWAKFWKDYLERLIARTE